MIIDMENGSLFHFDWLKMLDSVVRWILIDGVMVYMCKINTHVSYHRKLRSTIFEIYNDFDLNLLYAIKWTL